MRVLPICTAANDEALAAQANASDYSGNLTGLVDRADDDFLAGRPKLPPAGSFWRRVICDSTTGASADVCKTLLERFWLKTDQCADVTLTASQFNDLRPYIAQNISTIDHVTYGSFPNGAVKKGTVSVYGTPYATTFGTLTAFFDTGDNVVGFSNAYDFNLGVRRDFKYELGIAAFIMSLPHDGTGAYMSCNPSSGFGVRFP